MSIKEAGIEFVSKIHNELIKIRADQLELGQDLTERINGVANAVKRLDAKFEKKFDAVEQRFDGVEKRLDGLEGSHQSMLATQQSMLDTQTEMMRILLGIQRKLDVN
ncbi:hypothetical protein ACIBP6_18385 [Nonomuraea terrae]|uniref:hypothetical protein n=1 Tax=Nonomuraea terrae TaxID=2530383 RepID=UPI003791E20A